MFDQYDKYIKHLWEEDEKLKVQKQEALDNLNKEKDILRLREQEVNVLEKHKEHQREDYLKEEKARELKQLNEIGSQKHFMKQRDLKEQEEYEEYLENLENAKNGN